MKTTMTALGFVLIVALTMHAQEPVRATAEGDLAQQIVKEAGIHGGLVVHLGCGDQPQLTMALRANDAFVVQGLETDEEKVAKARKAIADAGLYGSVSVRQLTGDRLPYIDRLVNLLVVSDDHGIARAEIERVVAPGGTAVFLDPQSKITDHKLTKPWPAEMDEWHHYLHDADNNAVSRDQLVGPPQGMQWAGGPTWSRWDGYTSSANALATAQGRLFYILDETPVASFAFPAAHVLMAQDAFNGKILWKKPVTNWFDWKQGKKETAAIIPRRLVAIGDRVYATLSRGGPVSVLEAKTGALIHELVGTEGAEEILISGDQGVFVCGGESNTKDYFRDFRLKGIPQPQRRTIRTVNLGSNTVTWSWEGPVTELSLALDDRQAYFHNGTEIVALVRTDGKERWKSEPVTIPSKIPTYFGVTLVVKDGVVLFSGGGGIPVGHLGEIPPRRGEGTHASYKNSIYAFSSEDGKQLWTAPHPPSGYVSPKDILVVNDLVWFGETTGENRESPSPDAFTIMGHDLRTGKILKTYPPWASFQKIDMHHRCYRAKATVNWLMFSRRGIELLSPADGRWVVHPWSRAGCDYGVLPANGLLYFTQHACGCYSHGQLAGFNSLRAESALPKYPDSAPRLIKGPSFASIHPAGDSVQKSADWPTYRADGRRSATTATAVPDNLNLAWTCKLDAAPSAPTIAGGLVLLALRDGHVVVAIDELTGKERWRFTADGGVDSPPTIAGQRVFFGTRGGSVYCLRLDDGVLAWRFRLAPGEAQILDRERLESVWPVHGAVLLMRDRVYALAGRHQFHDGGMRLVALDAVSGEPVVEKSLDAQEVPPELAEDHQSWINRQWRPDLLAANADGDQIFMGQRIFDVEFNAGKKNQARFLPPNGFLDGDAFARSVWFFGVRGWRDTSEPMGMLLAQTAEAVYGYDSGPENQSAGRDYRLYRHNLARPAGVKIPRMFEVQWQTPMDLFVRALIVAGDRVAVAGPSNPIKGKISPGYDWQAVGVEGLRCWRGEKGAFLRLYAATDGRLVRELPLPAIPVWDGMAAANGALYIACENGQLVRLGDDKQREAK